ncbi:MAG TPA: hypothetical protein PLZ12_12185 [Saprospiraceae bacterium]|nr:hypothetical protein [Saprospiraceae bacterium]
MTNEAFFELLITASQLAYDFAKDFVTDELPANFKYSVSLSQSFDDRSSTLFDFFPDDDDKSLEFIDAAEAVEVLFRNNKVPVWIDISVESTFNQHTVFRLLCAGRYSSDEQALYYANNGTGSFGIKSPALPVDFVEGKKFKLHHPPTAH